MTQFPTLKSTPIKEIIFTISYSESIPMDTLRKFGEKNEIAKKFTFIGDGFTAKFTLDNQQNEGKASILKDGLILRCTEENKIIQAREGSFSLHKVNDYESFDTLLPEFLRYWETFLTCIESNHLTVNNISLRYLNFIELLEGEKFHDISNIIVVNPFVDDLDKYLVRMQFVDDDYKNVNIGLVTAPIKRELTDGLMLDTILNQSISIDVNNDLLKEYFVVMRVIKNDIFFKTITTNAIKRYQ